MLTTHDSWILLPEASFGQVGQVDLRQQSSSTQLWMPNIHLILRGTAGLIRNPINSLQDSRVSDTAAEDPR